MLALVALLTLALGATGFGHRMPAGDDLALETYALMGGTLADLCADLNGDGLPDEDCPICHLTANVDLTAADPAVRPADLAFVARIIAPRESRAVRSVLDPARGLRAPPLA